MSLRHAAEFPLSCTTETAAFITDQIGLPAAGVAPDLQHAHLAVLGLQSGCSGDRSRPYRSPQQPGCDELRLCALLLGHGAQLVVLDRPRNRMRIEALLSLAAKRSGRIPGSIRLERDLSSACRGADAVLLLPGWPEERPLAWGRLADRLRPGAQVFDLRRDGRCDQAACCGLRIWQLGAPLALF